ncbi:MAG: class I tRNA ligase family protein, partial [Solirubrobacteraceae bacterium]
DLIKQYGADGIRTGMLFSSPAGNDLLFDEKLCEQGRNFSNKIWNVFRLIKGWEVVEIEQPKEAAIATDWFENQFNLVLKEILENYNKFRISDALLATYKLIWDDFASWYLEIIKPAYGSPIDSKTYHSTIQFLENSLKLLHPVMPFITEEIWQNITPRTKENALIISEFPKEKGFSLDSLEKFKETQELISAIRNVRNKENISLKENLKLLIATKNSELQTSIIAKLANISISFENEIPKNTITIRVNNSEYALLLNEVKNSEEDKQKLLDELNYLEGFLKSVQNKLKNEKFVNNAPQNVLLNERKKEADASTNINLIKERLSSF